MLNVEWPPVIEHSTFNIRHSSELEPPGAVAQLGEHLLCKQGVVGSIPISSTKDLVEMNLVEMDLVEMIPSPSWLVAIRAASLEAANVCGEVNRKRLNSASIFAITAFLD